ncbi:ribulose-bisphosphate carboxylase large subunit, partial [Candidatus Falkowbacteria bacterium]|nr:ribulose-bisphosphate carboxylase large subunit [Candidatus Falkowbacteria bacterium]
MSHVGFIDQGYKPNLTKDLLATFYMEPNGPFEEAADAVAGESSIGSWTDLSTLKPEVAKKLKATVYYINQKQNIIK